MSALSKERIVMRSLVLALLLAASSLTVAPLVAPAHAANPQLVDYADLVERLSPAVVNVATKTKPKKLGKDEIFGPRGNPFAGTPFEQFFEQFGEGLGNLQTAPRESLGSGVIISPDGYVVTNNHVVDGADEIVVKFNGGREEYPAKLIGRDSKNDLSLLKIEGKGNLPYARLGDSDKVRAGQAVLAIGNPFGLGGTVTSGIVSALGRNIGQGPYDDFIQTDAAINPGNSGGPLFNVVGEVIGINAAIYTRSGGSNGIGFAIPANTVKMVVGQIKQYGHPVRGWLGVRIQTVTKDLAATLGLKDDVGALVSEVTKDSPAAKAGIENGDVILSFNGTAISEMSDLPRLVAETPIGTSVPVSLLREGKPLTRNVTIAKLEGDEDEVPPADGKDGAESGDVAGLTLGSLDAIIRRQLDLPDSVRGVVVEGVARGSAAAESGLARGDVITEVDWKKVATTAEVQRALKGRKGKVLLRVYRDDGYLFVPLNLAK
ncbi:MAG: DegQ family serine endoprotease [Pseudomonadaceae bacterium]|nr:DegQ family serine endoprotease [Pseudomonadaceae bacterium]